jgi:hypothetical protein
LKNRKIRRKMKKDNIPYDEKLDFGSGCEKKKYE